MEINAGPLGAEEGVTSRLSASAWVKGAEVGEAEHGVSKEPALGLQHRPVTGRDSVAQSLCSMVSIRSFQPFLCLLPPALSYKKQLANWEGLRGGGDYRITR